MRKFKYNYGIGLIFSFLKALRKDDISGFMNENEFVPYWGEFIYIFIKKDIYFFLISLISGFVLICSSIFNTSISYDFQIFLKVASIALPFGFLIAYIIGFSRVILSLFLDMLSRNPMVTEYAVVENIDEHPSTLEFTKRWLDCNYLMNRFFEDDKDVCPAFLFYNSISFDLDKTKLDLKTAIQFYSNQSIERECLHNKKVYFIISRQKSDLLDRLIDLEPTAAFEITYLKYSRQLQKIALIPGWEYADGVAELCEEISNMYP